MRNADKVQAGHLEQSRFRSTGVQMRDRVLRQFVCFQSIEMVSPNLGGRCASEGQGFVMVGTFLRKISVDFGFVSLQHGKLSRPTTCRPVPPRKLVEQVGQVFCNSRKCVRVFSRELPGPRGMYLEDETRWTSLPNFLWTTLMCGRALQSRPLVHVANVAKSLEFW